MGKQLSTKTKDREIRTPLKPGGALWRFGRITGPVPLAPPVVLV
jgi:hypothetical protein